MGDARLGAGEALEGSHDVVEDVCDVPAWVVCAEFCQVGVVHDVVAGACLMTRDLAAE